MVKLLVMTVRDQRVHCVEEVYGIGEWPASLPYRIRYVITS